MGKNEFNPNKKRLAEYLKSHSRKGKKRKKNKKEEEAIEDEMKI
jgi:hypothetical protein